MEKHKYLLTFTKSGLLIYISHLDLIRLFHRTVRRLDLPVVFSKGFHPLPEFKIKKALKLGIPGEDQKAELILNRQIKPFSIKQQFNFELPEEIRIVNVENDA